MYKRQNYSILCAYCLNFIIRQFHGVKCKLQCSKFNKRLIINNFKLNNALLLFLSIFHAFNPYYTPTTYFGLNFRKL